MRACRKGEGLPLSSLVRPNRPRARVAAAVKQLLANEWVGLSVHRDRVWLSSRTYDRLAEVLRNGRPSKAIPSMRHMMAIR